MKTTLVLTSALLGLAVLAAAGLLVIQVRDRLTRARDEAVWWNELKRRRAVYRKGMAVADARHAAIPAHEARAVADQVRRLLRQAETRSPTEPGRASANVRRFPRQVK